MARILLNGYSCKYQTHTLISSPSNRLTISWAGKVIRTCEWSLEECTEYNPQFKVPTARSSVLFKQKWEVSVLSPLYVHKHHSIELILVESFFIHIHSFHPKSLQRVRSRIRSTTLQSLETSFWGVLFPLHPTFIYFNSQSDLEIRA